MTDIRMQSPMRREVERRVQEFKNLDERSERQTMRVRISDLQEQLNERHRLMLKKDADHSQQLTRLIAQTAQQQEKIRELEHEREHLTVERGRYRAMWQEALEGQKKRSR